MIPNPLSGEVILLKSTGKTDDEAGHVHRNGIPSLHRMGVMDCDA
jgi:hypothetical protein